MGPIQVMVFFLLGLSHFSLAKVCPGCSKDNLASDPTVSQYLSDKLKDLKNVTPKGMESEEQAELVRVKNVKKQVVAGILYSYDFEARGLSTNKLYDCNLVVAKQLWKGKEEVIDYSCNALSSNKKKRSVLGGKVEIEVANGNLDHLKTFIGQEVGKSQKSQYLMKVTKFFKATKQVVEGILITATVEVANTNCLQNQISKTDSCQTQRQSRQVCEVEVWLKPGTEGKEVTRVECRPQPKYCAGCPVEMDTNDVTVQQCLKRTLSNLNAQSHSSNKLSLVKITKVTSQVIAGVKFTVEFDAKDESSSTPQYSCKAVIISQPWLSEEPAVAEFDCTPSSN